LLELEDIRARLQPFDPVTLTYPWRHDIAEVDELQVAIMRAVGVKHTRSRREIFQEVCKLAGVSIEMDAPLAARATIPFLNEPWYC
jgi:hypothetical protein